jgi:hypothetical protein
VPRSGFARRFVTPRHRSAVFKFAPFRRRRSRS